MTAGEAVALPVWQVIVETLRKEIQDGRYAGGEPMPPEAAIAGRFSVSRITARKSLAQLQQEGLIRIEQGRGTFVYNDMIPYDIGGGTRFSQNLLRHSIAPGRHLIRERTLPASREVARALGLRKGARVLHLLVLGCAQDRPISLGHNYYSAARFAQLGRVFREERSLSKALQVLGVADYRRRQTRIVARLPNREEAHLLQQPPGRPVVETVGLDVSGKGEAIAYGVTCFAGDRVQLVVGEGDDPSAP